MNELTYSGGDGASAPEEWKAGNDLSIWEDEIGEEVDKCESKSKGSGIGGRDEEETIGYDEKKLGLEMEL